MLENILRYLMPFKAVKKTVMFFAAFVLTVTVICTSFTEVRGDTVKTETAKVNVNTNTKTNVHVQDSGTRYQADAVTAEKTTIAAKTADAAKIARMMTLNITAKQAITAENSENELTVHEESGQIKQDSAEQETEKASKKEAKGFVYSDKIPLSYELQEYTFEKCSEYGLEYELVLAVMWRESRFNTNAINLNTNGTTDSGLMQINDVNRGWLYEKHGIEDLMDPYQNIDAGTSLLGELYKKYGEHGAMLAYQYGENGMQKKMDEGVTTSKSIEAAYRQRDYYRQIV